MNNLHYLRGLVSFYDESVEEGDFDPRFTFDEFVRNEWEKRTELVEGWSDEDVSPYKDTLSYYAGKVLGVL